MKIFSRKRSTTDTGNQVFDVARMSAQNIAGPVLAGMLIGGLIRAFAALPIAPSSGEETRAAMLQKAIELQNRATKTVKDTVSEAKYRAHEFKQNARSNAVEIKERGKELASEKLEREMAGT
jgi:gas vesicle protein